MDLFMSLGHADLTTADREFIILPGLNGCDKTTTMRMIGCFEDASEGDAFIGGCVVNDLVPKDRDMAMICQFHDFNQMMTINPEFRFSLKIRKKKHLIDDVGVKRVAEMVELNDFLHRKPRELLKDQRQRTARARDQARGDGLFDGRAVFRWGLGGGKGGERRPAGNRQPPSITSNPATCHLIHYDTGSRLT